MTRVVGYLSGVVLGVGLGAAVVNHVWISAHRVEESIVRSNLMNEQELLRDRAERKGDDLGVVVHSLSVAQFQAGTGFRWLERSSNHSYLEMSFFPWEIYRHRDLLIPPEKLKRGEEIVIALERGRAALALERLGLEDHAEAQWEAAAALVPTWPRANLRKSSTADSTRLNSKLQLGLERASLETTTWSKHAQVLQKTRESLGVDVRE
ncbi:MAG: hypothetical protein R3F35_11675 [Myxococcota bacterium]